MTYRKVGLTLLMAAALGLGVLSPKALADSNARIVRLSYVDGEAQIDNRDGRGFQQAFLNMPLGPGTRVSTRDDSRAEIEFEDMSTVRLAPNTQVEAQSLDLRSSGAKYTLVDLAEGTAYFNIRKLQDDDDFRITTGRREFSLARASRFRLTVDHRQVVLAVFNGEIEVIGESSQLIVRKNETFTLDLDDPSRYYLAKGVSTDANDDWNRDREDYRDRYASAGNYNGYSSAYSYGVTDLNYWGSYTYISGYGNMWRPYYYGVNWNPFNDGAWYWYPGSGWIWVSAYPWGWMPFRYGNWYYIGGHGWCWRPGHNWHRWSPVVAVHNPPPGHVVPTAPPPSGHHDPVVVGHGPATILPPEDPGMRRRGVREPNVLGKKSGSPAGGGGSGGVPPGSGSGGAASGGSGAPVSAGSGSGGNAGSGSGGSVGSGGSGQPAADSGRRPGVRGPEVDIEEAIRNARERRPAGGPSGGVITNSGPSSSGGSQSSGGSASSGSSGSGSSASTPTDSSDPFAGRGRPVESRRPIPQQDFVPSSGSSASSPAARSSSGGSGSGASSSGGSGSSGGSSSGGSSHASAPSSGSSGGGGSSAGSGSGGGRSSGGSSSGSSGRSGSSGSSGGRSSGSSGGRSSSAGSSSTATPK